MTYIPPKFAADMARKLSYSLELEPPLGRDDIIAASFAAEGGRFERALARTYGERTARAIIRAAHSWTPPRAELPKTAPR